MATKLDDLKLDDAHATAILEKAIEYEAYTEEMPDTKKGRISAASDQIALLIDAWNNDDINPDNEDPEIAEMGVAMQEVLELAGVEIDEEGEVEYGDLPDLDDEDEEDEDEDSDDDDEAAVDIEDIISGYEELSAAGRVKAIKKLELDAVEDDDDFNTAVNIWEWENEQNKPSSRVMSYLEEEVLPENWQEEAGQEGDEESDEEEEDEDDADDEEGESGEWEEPWKGYDKQSAVEVKGHLDKLLKKGELDPDMVTYVKEYEEAREKPPTRKRVVTYCEKLLADLEEGDADEPEDDEDEPEEKPARRGRSTSRRRGAKSADPDESDDVDEAVAADDEKESRRSRRSAKPKSSGSTITLTREQILEALENGSVEIEA